MIFGILLYTVDGLCMYCTVKYSVCMIFDIVLYSTLWMIYCTVQCVYDI